MKQSYHLCLSASNEVLFRDLEDYNRGFNCFALALYKTGSTGLVESFMSTHCHLMVQTDDPKLLMYKFRNAYSKYFNHKYERSGRLGEKNHFSILVVGYYHLIAAICYILRNPLHHGVCSIPFAYPFSTVNEIFRKELGKFYNSPVLQEKRSYSKFIGRDAVFPNTYKLSESGVFIRESVLDIPQVENLFVTPRAFTYHMIRKTSEGWVKEQSKDNNGEKPISILDIERGVDINDEGSMMRNELGKRDYRSISDIDLCTELNILVKNVYKKPSVYHLSHSQKCKIAEELYRGRHISQATIRRCLVL